MGSFGDALKTIWGAVTEKTKEMHAEYMEYREYYDHYDDEHLLRYYKSASGLRKFAIASLLSERGYGTQDE